MQTRLSCDLLVASRKSSLCGMVNPFVIWGLSEVPMDGQVIQIKRPYFKEHNCDTFPSDCVVSKSPMRKSRILLENLHMISDSEVKFDVVPRNDEEGSEPQCETVFSFEPSLETLPIVEMVWNDQIYWAEWTSKLSGMETDSWLWKQGLTEQEILAEEDQMESILAGVFQKLRETNRN